MYLNLRVLRICRNDIFPTLSHLSYNVSIVRNVNPNRSEQRRVAGGTLTKYAYRVISENRAFAGRVVAVVGWFSKTEHPLDAARVAMWTTTRTVGRLRRATVRATGNIIGALQRENKVARAFNRGVQSARDCRRPLCNPRAKLISPAAVYAASAGRVLRRR